ncbi:hypothetical protein EV421DRAFT_1860004 [Armillaria borealis]|uniref:Secreted protein n=1 Tax=Armillaria borealis TaxID=47425 RepID=A0AA39ME51_9AGAR|nr:hypothetical protein EV421DRAFT_1860004 [Armillaria borealis]
MRLKIFTKFLVIPLALQPPPPFQCLCCHSRCCYRALQNDAYRCWKHVLHRIDSDSLCVSTFGTVVEHRHWALSDNLCTGPFYVVAMKQNCNSWDDRKSLVRLDIHLLLRLRKGQVQLHELGREAVVDWFRTTLGSIHSSLFHAVAA